LSHRRTYIKALLILIPVIISTTLATCTSYQVQEAMPPIADVEYVLHVNPGEGGWILVKYWTYGRDAVSLSVGESMKSVINITGANVPYSYNSERGVITLNTSGREWVWFNYTFPRIVWYYGSAYGSYLAKRVLTVDVGEDYVQLWPKEVFFKPYDPTPRSIAIRLDGVLKEWFIIAAYTQRTGDLLFFDDFNMFLRSPFLAGKLYELAEAKAGDVTVYVPVFASRLLLSDYLNEIGYDGTYDILMGAQYKADIIARGIKVMSELLNLPPPIDRAYMYPLRKTPPEGYEPAPNYIDDMRLYGSVWVFHNDMIWRVGHILHHYVAPWLTDVYSLDFTGAPAPIWYKGMQDYVGYVAASIVTNSSIYNGSLIVPRYLLYLRSFEERKFSPGATWGGPAWVMYDFAPLAMFYLDNILREKSGGLLDIYKLHGLTVANRKWQTVDVSEAESLLEKEFGINMSEYFNEVRNLEMNETLLKEFVEGGRWFDYFYTFLDFIRENFTLAPDTLYAVYLEYVAWRGDPEGALYPFDYGLFEEIVSDLIQALNGTKPLTEEAFIDALNKITGNKSSDFFEFYSTYAHLNLSVTEVEAFINGTYPRILSKIISAKNIINAMSRAVDVSDFREELNEAYTLLKRGNYSGAELLANRLLEKLYEAKNRDSDGDGVPDWVEALYGTNPSLPDTDGDGVGDLYEVFRGRIEIDGDISDWTANSAYILNVTRSRAEDPDPTISGNTIKSVYVAHDDEYLYVAIQFFDKPYSAQNRIILDFDADLDFRTDNDRASIYINIPGLIGMETLGLGYFGDFVEVKIPLETLQLQGMGREFMLRVYIDTWGDTGLPYEVSALERRSMDSLDILVDLDSLPSLPSDRVVGIPVTETTTVTTTTTTTVPTTITTTVTQTSTVTTTVPTTVTTSVPTTVTTTMPTTATTTVSTTVTATTTETKTITVPTTVPITVTATTTRTVSETSYITKIEAFTTTATMVSIAERTVTVTKVETSVTTLISTVEKPATITSTVTTPTPTTETITIVAVVSLMIGFALGYAVKKR